MLDSQAILREDAVSRRAALHPRRSFVVQAPAGSGKTGLLIQRVLMLLRKAGQPEEVVAITFTRKAAAEMRQRILGALAAAGGPPPETPHERRTWRLARAVARRDARLGWHLAENPGRLRALTIDALCREIALRQPLLARLGGAPGVTKEARPLHREAARAALAELERGGSATEDGAAGAIRRLLLHLDNDSGLAERMLMSMLARRDQWFRHLPSGGMTGNAGAGLRDALEAALRRTVADALLGLRARFPEPLRQELAALLEYAAAHRAEPDEDAAWKGIAVRPDPERSHDLEVSRAGWRAAASLLLTERDEWRKPGGITERHGFPAPSAARTGADRQRRAEMKERARALLASLEGDEPLRAALAAAKALPYLRYPAAQWEVLEALLRLLPVALGKLDQVFVARGTLDFAEVAAAATRVLERRGGPDESDPARHLLIDEFQDTSSAQYRLIEALTAGWREEDGRTLFLVGDPMQSIYRFREADVGLFLRVWQNGLGALRLVPLRLAVNFRAQRALVGWVNAAFPHVLPAEASIEKAAVPFTKACAAPDAAEGPAVRVHPFLGRDDAAEAARVASLTREADPEGIVAILVRSRAQLGAVLPALRGAGIAYRALEIDPLNERPAVQDLLALARALLHPADRIAWLAVLRAPWCGLRLEELLRLAGEAPEATLWELLPERADALAPEARARLERVRAVLARALGARGRHPLRRWIEETWIALGGPACLDAAGLADAEAFLALLGELEGAAEAPEAEAMLEAVERLYAPPHPTAGEQVQVMTIHAAKGLEFDTVILPGLGKRSKRDDPELLLWWERPDSGGGELLLAPLGERGERDPCYEFLRGVEQEKARHEMGRLLYVAATRAKRALHLLAHAEPRSDGSFKPGTDTFLERLWPAVAARFAALEAPDGAHGVEPGGSEQAPPAAIRRLVEGWRAPEPPARVLAPGAPEPVAADEPEAPPPLEYLWTRTATRHVGTVVHLAMQRMAALGAPAQQPSWIQRRRALHRAALARLGVPRGGLEEALQRVETALLDTVEDPRGRWVLAAHPESACELPLTGWEGGRPVEVILDRTFVDDRGVRWIIDYKTGSHEGAESEAFLDAERERYRPQLERYARILAGMSGEPPRRPIRLGLYFPLLRGWREWEAGEGE
jgi:ATP-dependent exoDNAse (exonuclease V) beta subunit